jgi:hypothetical protein
MIRDSGLFSRACLMLHSFRHRAGAHNGKHVEPSCSTMLLSNKWFVDRILKSLVTLSCYIMVDRCKVVAVACFGVQ